MQKNFIKLVAHASVESSGLAQRLFFQHMSEIINLLTDSLEDALPELSDEERKWRFLFAIGAVAHTLRFFDTLPGQFAMAQKEETGRLIDILVDFVTAGLVGVDK